MIGGCIQGDPAGKYCQISATFLVSTKGDVDVVILTSTHSLKFFLKAINQDQGNHMAGKMCHGCEEDLG